MCAPHGGPDDVRAMDAILMAKLLRLIEPLSSQVSQMASVHPGLLQVLDTLVLELLQLSISFQHSQDGFLLLFGQETQVNHGDSRRCVML